MAELGSGGTGTLLLVILLGIAQASVSQLVCFTSLPPSQKCALSWLVLTHPGALL